MKKFYEDATEEEIQEVKDKIDQFHQRHSEIKEIDVQKILKIEFIRPELREIFPDYLEQAYGLFKDNDKFHRGKKA